MKNKKKKRREFEDVLNYSTWSKNYQRRYKDSKIFDQIFRHIIKIGIDKHYIDITTVFGDGTHRKANANIRKATNTENQFGDVISLLDKIKNRVITFNHLSFYNTKLKSQNEEIADAISFFYTKIYII